MSVKYSLVAMRNPLKPDAPKKFYAKAQASGIVSVNEIVDEICYASSMTDGDVLSVIRGLIKMIKKHLAAGEIVHLAELGRFQFQLSSKGAATTKEFTASNIQKVRFQFCPGALVKEVNNSLVFTRVSSKSKKSLELEQVEDAL